MLLDARQGRAAKAVATREPIRYGGFDDETVLAFNPEMPLAVLFGMEQAPAVSLFNLRVWLMAHLELDAKCDTSCVDDPDGECKAVADFKARTRLLRVDGVPLTEDTMTAMWDAVRDAQGVDEGESSSSAKSSGKAGDTSSGTSSRTTRRPSSKRATAGSGDSARSLTG
jgi:hypothetical protein